MQDSTNVRVEERVYVMKWAGRFRSVVVFCLAVWLAFVAGVCRAETGLREADAVLAEATSLDDFLGKPELIEKYYTALKNVYGGELNRISYDTIIKKLTDIRDNVPGLKDALWKPRTGEGFLGPFSIQPATEISGRRVGENFRVVEDLKAKLEADAAELGAVEGRKERAQEILQHTRERVRAFNESLLTMPGGKRAKGAATGQFYAELAADPKVKAATAFILGSRLASPEVTARIATNDADILFQTFEELRTSTGVGQWSSAGLGEVPQELNRFITDLVPKKQALLDDRASFPDEYRTTRNHATVPVGSVSRDKIEFVPMHPLHGIFKGVCLGECVGGGSSFLSTASPERWGNSALPGAQVIAVYQNGRYHGFMMVVPMKGPEGHTYWALDKGAGILRNKAIVQDALTGEWKRSTLFELFVERLNSLRPPGIRGVLVSDSDYGDAAEVKQTALNSEMYKNGVKLGGKDRFTHLDPAFVAAIIKVSPTHSYAGTYGGNMIFDVVNKDSTDVRLLTGNPAVFYADAVSRVSPEQRIAAIGHGLESARTQQNASLEYLYTLAALVKDTDPHVRDLARLAYLDLEARKKYGKLFPDTAAMTLIKTNIANPQTKAADFLTSADERVRTRAAEVQSLSESPSGFFGAELSRLTAQQRIGILEEGRRKLSRGQDPGVEFVYQVAVMMKDADPDTTARAELTAVKLRWLASRPDADRTYRADSVALAFLDSQFPDPPPNLRDLMKHENPKISEQAVEAVELTLGRLAYHRMLWEEMSHEAKLDSFKTWADLMKRRGSLDGYGTNCLAAAMADTHADIRDLAVLTALEMEHRIGRGATVGDIEARAAIVEQFGATRPSVESFFTHGNDQVRQRANEVMRLMEGEEGVKRAAIRGLTVEKRLDLLETELAVLRRTGKASEALPTILATLVVDADRNLKDRADLAALEVEGRIQNNKLYLSSTDRNKYLSLMGEPRPTARGILDSPGVSPENATKAKALLAAEERKFSPTCLERMGNLAHAAGDKFAKLSQKAWEYRIGLGLTAAGVTAAGLGYEWWEDWKHLPSFLRPDRSSKNGKYLRGGEDGRPAGMETDVWYIGKVNDEVWAMNKKLYQYSRLKELKKLEAERAQLIPEMEELLKIYKKDGWSDEQSRKANQLKSRAQSLSRQLIEERDKLKEATKWY